MLCDVYFEDFVLFIAIALLRLLLMVFKSEDLISLVLKIGRVGYRPRG